jgi:hypothetical protein
MGMSMKIALIILGIIFLIQFSGLFVTLAIRKWGVYGKN